MCTLVFEFDGNECSGKNDPGTNPPQSSKSKSSFLATKTGFIKKESCCDFVIGQGYFTWAIYNKKWTRKWIGMRFQSDPLWEILEKSKSISLQKNILKILFGYYAGHLITSKYQLQCLIYFLFSARYLFYLLIFLKITKNRLSSLICFKLCNYIYSLNTGHHLETIRPCSVQWYQ